MYKLLAREENHIVVSKDEGVPFHKDKEQQGLVSNIRNDLHLNELYPVHRLDRMTSGLLLFALDKTTAAELSFRFAQGEVEKIYVAIAESKPQKKQGTVTGDMTRSRNGTWKLLRSRTNPAITKFISTSMTPGLRVYLLKPLTGKTHQLRVALKALGVPVAGDSLYYPANENRFDRGYLHAYSLKFELKGKELTYTDMPADGELFKTEEFRSAFERIRLKAENF
ncbi:MAG: TIGR01621 family pseudouridine synthase [Chitinispirillaceae bacterium]